MNTPRESRPDDAWIAELRTGNSAAIGDLRALLCHRLECVLAGKVGQSDAEDFAQQALAKILVSLNTFRGDCRFTTWASAIAVRVAYADLRRKQWGNVPLDTLTQDGKALAAITLPDSSAAAARAELVSALRAAIDDCLSERQRKVVLAELQGMPTSVLSEQLGVSRGALYKTHHDARKKLRQYLEAQGFGADDFRFALDGTTTP